MYLLDRTLVQNSIKVNRTHKSHLISELNYGTEGEHRALEQTREPGQQNNRTEEGAEKQSRRQESSKAQKMGGAQAAVGEYCSRETTLVQAHKSLALFKVLPSSTKRQSRVIL